MTKNKQLKILIEQNILLVDESISLVDELVLMYEHQIRLHNNINLNIPDYMKERLKKLRKASFQRKIKRLQ